jgi:hypothetical protein
MWVTNRKWRGTGAFQTTDMIGIMLAPVLVPLLRLGFVLGPLQETPATAPSLAQQKRQVSTYAWRFFRSCGFST